MYVEDHRKLFNTSNSQDRRSFYHYRITFRSIPIYQYTDCRIRASLFAGIRLSALRSLPKDHGKVLRMTRKPHVAYKSVLAVVPGVYCARRGPTCGFAAPRYVYPVSYSRSAGTKGESGPDGLEHVRRYNARPPAFAQRYRAVPCGSSTDCI